MLGTGDMRGGLGGELCAKWNQIAWTAISVVSEDLRGGVRRKDGMSIDPLPLWQPAPTAIHCPLTAIGYCPHVLYTIIATGKHVHRQWHWLVHDLMRLIK